MRSEVVTAEVKRAPDAEVRDRRLLIPRALVAASKAFLVAKAIRLMPVLMAFGSRQPLEKVTGWKRPARSAGLEMAWMRADASAMACSELSWVPIPMLEST